MKMRLLLLALIGFCVGCHPGPDNAWLPGENYSLTDALAGAERGKPVVFAILKFEADTGLWPDQLNELVPDYLTDDEVKPWRYHTFHHDDFSLVYLGSLTGGTLHYDRDRGKLGAWNVWWHDKSENQHIDKLDVVQPQPPPSVLTRDQQASKRLALLRGRVEAMPNRVDHRAGLMCHYFDLGQFKDARAVCVNCIEKWPDYWWSYLMLAKIEGRLGNTSDAERRLKRLAERWDDFFGYALLAQFYFDRKNIEESLAALRQALKPPQARRQEPYKFEQIGYQQSLTDETHYHNAAYLAYRMGDRKLCMAICDRWRQFVLQVQNHGGQEERALRVVCALNEADWGAADRLLRAMRQPPDFAPWQEDGIRLLEDVVRDQNARYEYSPNLFRNSGTPPAVEFDYK